MAKWEPENINKLTGDPSLGSMNKTIKKVSAFFKVILELTLGPLDYSPMLYLSLIHDHSGFSRLSQSIGAWEPEIRGTRFGE